MQRDDIKPYQVRARGDVWLLQAILNIDYILDERARRIFVEEVDGIPF